MMTDSRSDTRKSERLEKQAHLMTPVKRKAENDDKHNTPSPLRRSERGKKDPSTSSSVSRCLVEASNSSEANRKNQRGKNLNELHEEATEVGVSRKSDEEFSGIKRKRLGDARSFKTLFRPQYMVDITSDDSRRNDAPSDTNCVISQLSASKLVEPLANDAGEECSIRSDDRAGKLVSRTQSSVANISRVVGEAELSNSRSRGSLEPPVTPETCGKCSKKLRLKHDSPEQELCSCNDKKLGTCDKLIGAPTDLQMGCHDKLCYVCRKDGDLLFCHGMSCENCYHISCLDPPLGNVQPTIWHCIHCVEKKIRSGVHSVSKGVEEIWDSREVISGKHSQKQYLVKYQGLSHVHNQWVPEIKLHPEASHLVDRFIQNQQQGLRWNLEWTVPHRLLKKRSLNGSGSDSITSCCRHEWLVKWCKLGYEQATWELEDAEFLQSSLGEKLMKEYGLRTEKVKIVVDKHSEGSYTQMTKLPSGGSTSKDRSILNNVNKLREFWYKDQNALVFDDQDRIISSIFFIQSLADIGHPFFIIASPEAVSHWETELKQVAPSVDFVVYAGNEEARRSIRALEFYEEGSRVIPQVLLASSEAASEDVHLLKDLRWGAILIDELDGKLSTHLEQMRILTINSRLILFASQLKDRVPDYFGMLSLLDCRGSSKGGKLSRYMPYGSMAEPSSKFVEYWVPAQISNLQLEQYCATLLSNSMYLRSTLKSDLVGAAREILTTIKKCCDHPYLVDSTLQGSILKTLHPSEFLDVGIKASGKLQLLDRILSEIKTRQLRVLILFQPIVGSAMPIGDILEDFVRQRFGQNTYERIDTHVAKKQAALNRFNQKDSEQFVFLLEKGACGSAIKLTSVDTVVMFDSDWNPGNDFRALQKISIDSQLQIKVFRLYSTCTIEEKALILAKQNIHIDINIQNISRSYTDTVIPWGASILFNRLEEFHSSQSRSMLADIACDDTFANNVLSEVRATLSVESELKDQENSLLAEVRQVKGIYCSNFPLLGERSIQSVGGEEAPVFWKNLLEGRNPCWRYPCPMTRNRKRGQNFDGSSKKQGIESDSVKKHQKVNHNGKEPAAGLGIRDAHQSPPVPAMDGGVSCASPSSLNSHENIDLPERNKDQSVERLISNGQKGVHVYLISELEKLCEILALKEDVKRILHAFLAYLAENHRVSKDNVAIFQALQISLCWIAASILKRKIDRRESLLLAKQKLNFECSDKQAESVYEKLRMLRKTFLQQPNIIKELQALVNPTETESLSVLREKQQEEIDEFHKHWEERRLFLENKKSLEAAIIRQIHNQVSVRTEKLKMLDADFSRKFEEDRKSMEAGLKALKKKHVDAMSKKAEEVGSSAPIAPTSEGTEVTADVPEEVRCTDDPDTNATVTHSMAANDGEDTPDLVGNQMDDANGTDHSSDQVIDSADHGISTPVSYHQATTADELLQCAMSGEVEGECRNNQDNLSQFVESIESENVSQLATTRDNGPASEPNHPQPQPQVRENLGTTSSSDIRIPNISNTQHSLPPVNNQGGELTSGFRTSLRRVNDGLAQRIGNQLGLTNSNQIPHANPFQIELEKLRKESEQATKVHENLKLQLKSDCEKEIAEIRRKYEAKVQEAEATFQLKRKTLDTNVNKVYLNKILADAVSTKCIDRPPFGVWTQQAMRSGFMQQLQQIPARGPSNVGSSSGTSTPAAAQQNKSLALVAEHRPAPPSVGTSSRPPVISSISRPQTNARVGADVRSPAPHLQSVSPEIRTAAPHLQSGGADIRAAAPHLQPSRPPVSVPVPNQPSLTPPSQVRPVQPSAIQPSEPSPGNPNMLPLPQISGSRTSPSETQRGGPSSYYSSHPSAQELLMDIQRRFNAGRPSPSVSPVVLESNVGPMSQPALGGGVHGGLTSNTEVVCLSDDE